MTARRVLVTGASTGLGEAATQRLVAAGHCVFAGVRRPEDGLRMVESLGERCIPILLDVTDVAAIEAARLRIASAGGLDALVNNAGIAVTGPLEFLDLADVRRQFEVNLFGVLAVTQAMLPMLRETCGRLVVVGSVAGRNAMPLLGPYCASKHSLEAIVPALRMELAASGIKVAMIEPGSFRTPIWQRSDQSIAEMIARLPPQAIARYGRALAAVRETAANAGRRGSAPEIFARAVLHAVESARPRRRYVVGGDARLQLALGRLASWLREPLIQRLARLA